VLTRRQHNALRVAADRARLAPSVHNTQPWQLRLHPDRLELLLDDSRRLPTMDPQGRELVISVGAALLNARVGMAAVSHACSVSHFPDPTQPDLAAVMRPAPGLADSELAALDPVVSLRRSNRTQFAGAAPVEVTDRLGAVADTEGASLFRLSEPQRRILARATAAARAVQESDEGYVRELGAWTSRPARERDGVHMQPTWTSRSGTGAVLLRDFTSGHLTESGGLDVPKESESLLVLATDGDHPMDWLYAGEALERVLLEIVRLGWQAGLITQPVEVPATRQELARLLPAGLVPQAVIRVGRGVPPSGTAPRRRTVDVLRDLTMFPRGPGEEIAAPTAPSDALQPRRTRTTRGLLR
jgi:hypothetical protein